MSAIDIDTALIEKLAELLHKGGLSEIEISQGEIRIRVARERLPAAAAPAPAPAHTVEAAAAGPPAAESSDPLESPPAERTVTAPMVGTVYLQPEPGAPPFVRPGDRVEEGQTLRIIEAMKVMNPIRAPRAGRVGRILVANAQPVEYGEPLLVLE